MRIACEILQARRKKEGIFPLEHKNSNHSIQEFHADIVVIGGGTGGCAAALAAAKSGKTVIMTEETDWIGGQLTSQAVPPDEHPWIEQSAAPARTGSSGMGCVIITGAISPLPKRHGPAFILILGTVAFRGCAMSHALHWPFCRKCWLLIFTAGGCRFLPGIAQNRLMWRAMTYER